MLWNMETEAERATKKKLKKAAMQVIRWWCVFYSSMFKIELKPSSITWACIGDVMGLEMKTLVAVLFFLISSAENVTIILIDVRLCFLGKKARLTLSSMKEFVLLLWPRLTPATSPNEPWRNVHVFVLRRQHWASWKLSNKAKKIVCQKRNFLEINLVGR